MARKPGLIKRALIRQENETVQSFFSQNAIQNATQAYDNAIKAAQEAAKAGATDEQLQPLRQIAGQAAATAGELVNTAIHAARSRGLAVPMKPVTQGDVDAKIRAFDAQVLPLRQDPARAGQQAGEEAIAKLRAELGREPTDEEKAKVAGIASGGPFQGTGMRQQSANLVLSLANKFRKGEQLTDEEKSQYAFAYAELSRPQMVGSAQTGFSFIATRPDPSFPTPAAIGAASIPGTGGLENQDAQVIPAKRSPDQSARLALMQNGLRQARSVRDAIVSPDGSVNRTLMTTMIFDVPGSEGRTVRNDFENAIAAKLRLETGAAATPVSWPRNQQDTPKVVLCECSLA